MQSITIGMKLRHQLAKTLEAKDLTVAQLSRKTQVPQQTIGNWLSGRKPKDIDQVKKVADVLGVTLDFLLYGIEPQNPVVAMREEILSGTFEVVLRRPRQQ